MQENPRACSSPPHLPPSVSLRFSMIKMSNICRLRGRLMSELRVFSRKDRKWKGMFCCSSLPHRRPSVPWTLSSSCLSMPSSTSSHQTRISKWVMSPSPPKALAQCRESKNKWICTPNLQRLCSYNIYISSLGLLSAGRLFHIQN